MKNAIFLIDNLLLSAFPLGFISLIVMFLLCFGGVHIIKLAKLGWDSRNHEKPKNTPVSKPADSIKEKAPASQPQEPVYYIVERKKKRPKTSYGEPKEIRFK